MVAAEQVTDLNNITVADVALSIPGALDILNHHNLDYCCGGKKPFAEVCKKMGLDAESLWDEIQIAKANHSSDSRMRFDTWETPFLIQFILQHHHQYVREAIPAIMELLNKVCTVHGGDCPYLLKVREDFELLATELLNHMPKEEGALFPAILNNSKPACSSCRQEPGKGALEAPISVMEHEHENAGTLIKSIRRLTNEYTPPDFACTTFKAVYQLLEQFDQDLMQHIHLENNILFPRAKTIQIISA